MARKTAHPPEFRRKILELVRSGRRVAQIAREFDLSRQTIMNWVKRDDLDSGVRTDGLTTEDREENARLRKRVRELEMERDILKKAAAWFARESNAIPPKSSSS